MRWTAPEEARKLIALTTKEIGRQRDLAALEAALSPCGVIGEQRVGRPRGGGMKVTTDRLIHEREARASGFTLIAGVDEAGRAAWAGPMVAAAVILREDFDPDRIRSSKKMSPASRLRAYDRIMSEAISVGVHEVSAAEIDAKGIDPCHMELLRGAVDALDIRPDFVLVDHYTIPDLEPKQESINNGDDLSVSIGAASIVAKVTLDRIMEEFAEQYPKYRFDVNKGYGTPQHQNTLADSGPSPIHRFSSRGVRRAIRPSDE